MPSKVRVKTPISSCASETGLEEKSPVATRSAAFVRLTIGVTSALASRRLSSTGDDKADEQGLRDDADEHRTQLADGGLVVLDVNDVAAGLALEGNREVHVGGARVALRALLAVDCRRMLRVALRFRPRPRSR